MMLTFTQETGFAETVDAPERDGFSDAPMPPVAGLRLAAYRAVAGAEHDFFALIELDDARQCVVADEADLVGLAVTIGQLHTGKFAEQLSQLLPVFLRTTEAGSSYGVVYRELVRKMEEA